MRWWWDKGSEATKVSQKESSLRPRGTTAIETKWWLPNARTWPSSAWWVWRPQLEGQWSPWGDIDGLYKVHPQWCSPSATWMMSSSMRRPTGNRSRGTTARATQAMRYTMLQNSWLPLGTKTCPDARVWGGFQRCTIACTNLGSIPNLLTVRGLAKWLQLNLLLSTTPLLVPLLVVVLFSC